MSLKVIFKENGCAIIFYSVILVFICYAILFKEEKTKNNYTENKIEINMDSLNDAKVKEYESKVKQLSINHNTIEFNPKNFLYSFQMAEYIRGKTILFEMRINDIVKVDSNYNLKASQSSRYDIIYFNLKLDKKWLKDLVVEKERFSAVIKCNDLRAFPSYNIEGYEEGYDIFVSHDIIDKYKIIDGEILNIVFIDKETEIDTAEIKEL